MTVSVIIPTYNGADKILKCLKALKNQTVMDFNVIVVDDGSTDNTLEVIEGQEIDAFPLTVISQDNNGRAHVRNTGAGMAEGDLLIFYDDDVRPEPDSIENHIEFHKTHEKSICTGFPIEDESLVTKDVEKYKLHLSNKWTSKFKGGINKMCKADLFLTAANLSLSKQLFSGLGGFNNSLPDAEDFEFAVRAIEQGIDIYFDKSNIAWHDDFITCKKYIMRQREYAKSNIQLEEIVPPEYHRSTLTLESFSWIKRLIFTFFAKSFWVRLIDEEKLTWLPKKIRYKIYDLVITSLGVLFIKTSLEDA